MTQTFNCPTCGAPLDYDGGSDHTIRCPFCNNVVIVPESIRGTSGQKRDEEPIGSGTSRPLTIGQTPEWREIKSLLQDGSKIEAIKRFRELTGAGLKESKDAIEKIEEGRGFEVESYAVLVKQTGLPRAALDRASQIYHIGQLLQQGKKIEAIEAYQTQFGVDRDEAVDAIEKLQTTVNTPGAFEIIPPTTGATYRPPTRAASEAKKGSSALTIVGFAVLLSVIIFSCYAVSIMDEYDTFDISVVFRGTPTYTPEPTEDLPATEAAAPTSTPAPTPTPEIATPNIIASCIGSGPRCFDEGRFVGVDAAGNIYAGERNGRIQIYDSEGDYQTEWSTLDQDSFVGSMAVSREGIVFVVQNGNIYRYSGLPGGEPGTSLGTLEYEGGQGFQSIAIAPDGGLVASWNKDWMGGFFTNFTESQDDIVIFDAEGSVIRVISQALSVAASGNPELSTEVAVDGDGNIYASGTLNNSGIYKLSPEGKLLDRFGEDVLNGSSVNSMAIDAQGRIFVTGGSELLVFDSTGHVLGSLDYGGIGLAIAGNGDLLAMDQHELFRFVLTDN
jgi:LSD1 subclass zinc finger protein